MKNLCLKAGLGVRVCVFGPQEVGAIGGGSVTQHTY